MHKCTQAAISRTQHLQCLIKALVEVIRMALLVSGTCVLLLLWLWLGLYQQTHNALVLFTCAAVPQVLRLLLSQVCKRHDQSSGLGGR